MKFGFGIPSRGPLANMESISHITIGGEKLGFDIVTVSDHIVVPRSIDSIYPYNETGEFAGRADGEYLEQLTTLMAIASITDRLRLLTSVMVLPHRSPVLTAKILATIDVLSNGRLDVGCGVGWMKEEFDAIGAPPFEERGAVGSEYLKAFKELWTSENPSFRGNYCNFSNISFLPKPVQKPHPPIWVGGESPPALRRAASLADCWYPIGSNPKFPLDTPKRLTNHIERLRGYAEGYGRDNSEIDIAFSVNWYSAQNSNERTRWFTGNPSEIVADIEQMASIGVNHLVLSFPGDTADEILEDMSYFQDHIGSQIHT